MLQVTPKLFLGTIGEFGDAGVLGSHGIELAVLVHPFKTFPHTVAIEQATFYVQENGNTKDWYVRGLARLLADIYNLKVLGLSDQTGGFSLAAFVVACTYAQNQATSFNAGKAWLGNIVGAVNLQIPAALDAQGQTLWP